jgi:hypothetical protein
MKPPRTTRATRRPAPPPPAEAQVPAAFTLTQLHDALLLVAGWFNPAGQQRRTTPRKGGKNARG